MEVNFQSNIRLFQIDENGTKEIKYINIVLEIFQRKIIRILAPPENQPILMTYISNIINPRCNDNENLFFMDLKDSKTGVMTHVIVLFESNRKVKEFLNVFVVCKFELIKNRRAKSDDQYYLDQYKYDIYTSESLRTTSIKPKEFSSVGRAVDNGRNSLLLNFPEQSSNIVIRTYNNKSSIGLFSQDAKFIQAIPSVVSSHRNPIIPSDALLSGGGQVLELLDDQFPEDIHLLDMKRGEVVGKMRAIGEYSIEHKLENLLPISGKRSTPDFAAFNDKNVFRFDPRESNTISQMTSYTTSNLFTCGATHTDGRLVMGSNDGFIRLYDHVCQNRAAAKIFINPGTDEITDITISQDGQYVASTCDEYIAITGLPQNLTSSYAFSHEQNSRRVIRLSITQANMIEIARRNEGRMPPFLHGRFSDDNQFVLASCGPALIAWDFNAIRRGKNPNYWIKIAGQEVIVHEEPNLSYSNVIFISKNQVSVVKDIKS